jgi:hypothetical protein
MEKYDFIVKEFDFHDALYTKYKDIDIVHSEQIDDHHGLTETNRGLFLFEGFYDEHGENYMKVRKLNNKKYIYQK